MPVKKRFPVWLVLLLLFCLLSCKSVLLKTPPEDSQISKTVPPAGLLPGQVPQFVVFGSDDNGFSGLPASGAEGGMEFLTSQFSGRVNPAAGGNEATFDQRPWQYSFFVNTIYLSTRQNDLVPYGGVDREDPELVREAWLKAVAAGHEIGVHTHSHPHGRELSYEQWRREMEQCLEILVEPALSDNSKPGVGLGLARESLIGFRTPYLEYNDETLRAALDLGFLYDCSVEEGWQAEQDGRNFHWPYLLDQGSPADPQISAHQGLWEIPVYVFTVPPDHECEKYGLAPGLRASLAERQDYFDPLSGKITGMDWNLWVAFNMTPEEFLATLRHSLDLRLQGNRCPLTVGLHSELYSDKSDTSGLAATAAERHLALRAFFDYLQGLQEVRVVSKRELLSWLRQPEPLSGY